MRRSSLFGLLISLAFLTGCSCTPQPQTPVYGTIVDVYREFRLGRADGTTVVKLPSGRIIKYTGRLGKKGEQIRVDGMIPTN